MRLTQREQDKLMIAMAAIVPPADALSAVVKLNHPESIALITDFVVEGCPRRSPGGGPDGSWRTCHNPRSGDGGHSRDDP